jgi:hypothetical protein
MVARHDRSWRSPHAITGSWTMTISEDQARDDEPAFATRQADARADGDAEDRHPEPAARTGRGALAGMATIHGEMLKFIAGRWSETLNMSGLLLECRGDASKATILQADFACRATAQYLEAAAALMALTRQVARDCWSPAAWGVVDPQPMAGAA